MSRLAVLMYHRICPRNGETACYFARGTAVTPNHFAAQMRYLADNADVVPLARLDGARTASGRTRPAVVLTFDDGYADVRKSVLPVCRDLGLPFSVFPIAGHTAESVTPCWVDWYYALLHRARERGPHDLRVIGTDCDLHAPGIDDDLRWWVRGPFKDVLRRAEPMQRARIFDRLASSIAAEVDVSKLAAQLYLSTNDLRELLSEGAEVGGHGLHHVRLRECSTDERRREITGSVDLLAAMAAKVPYWFCYPDGSYDEDVAAEVATAGFVGAFTVEPGFVTPETPPFAIPRFLVRDSLPNAPGWCGAAPGVSLC